MTPPDGGIPFTGPMGYGAIVWVPFDPSDDVEEGITVTDVMNDYHPYGEEILRELRTEGVWNEENDSGYLVLNDSTAFLDQLKEVYA